MTCEFRDDVAALLLGGLSRDEAVRVEAHVLGCDECSRHRRDLAIVRSLLDTLPAEPLAAEPSDLRESVVASMVATPQAGRRRDLRLVLLGAAAALLLAVGAFAVVRALRSDPVSAAQKMENVSPGDAPNAWAVVNLHGRAAGTIVDLEAGDLPADGATYALRVEHTGELLAQQDFTVNTDGWAQVLVATSRPLGPGDVIEVTRVDGATPVTLFRCECRA